MEKNRVAFVDGLRILSIFAVVVVHICADGWGKLPVSDPDWRILNIFASSVRWCVPLFVMISGIFMLKPDKHISVPSTMLEACAIFVFFREMKAFSTLSDKGSSFLGSVSSLVFGIYLIHPVFVSLVWKLGLSTSSFFMPLAIITFSVGVFLVSLATVAVLRKLGPWARYVL